VWGQQQADRDMPLMRRGDVVDDGDSFSCLQLSAEDDAIIRGIGTPSLLPCTPADGGVFPWSTPTHGILPP
jgi:hypothetical protein